MGAPPPEHDERTPLTLTARTPYRPTSTTGYDTDDILSIVDGCLLVDAWGELFLPEQLRAAWADTIESDLA